MTKIKEIILTDLCALKGVFLDAKKKNSALPPSSENIGNKLNKARKRLTSANFRSTADLNRKTASVLL